MNLSSRGAPATLLGPPVAKKEKIRGTLSRCVEKCRVSFRRSSSRSENQDHLPLDNSTSDLQGSENLAAQSHWSTRTLKNVRTPIRHYRLCPRAADACSRLVQVLKNSWRIFATISVCDLWTSRSCSEGRRLANLIPSFVSAQGTIYHAVSTSFPSILDP